MEHYDNNFEKVSDYEYKCISCGEVMKITRRPIVIHDAKGRLKVQLVSE
jgi:hypothetical protein